MLSFNQTGLLMIITFLVVADNFNSKSFQEFGELGYPSGFVCKPFRSGWLNRSETETSDMEHNCASQLPGYSNQNSLLGLVSETSYDICFE